MKNIIFYISFILSLLLISCHRNYNLETKEGIESAKEKIIEAFGNKKINSLVIYTNSSVVPRSMPVFNSVTVIFEENGQSYYQTLQDDLKKPMECEKPEIEKSFTINEVNFEEIPSKISMAKRMIENSEQYSFINLGSWETSMNENNKLVHYFKLFCIFKKPHGVYPSTFHTFEIDENGNLKQAL